MKETAKRILHMTIGIAAFVTLALLLPAPPFETPARFAIATIVLMVYWWISRPVHIAVTALLPVLVVAFTSIVPMASVLDDYFSPIAVLLLGAGVIIACWKSSGLDRRIALLALRIIGPSVRLQLVVWFVLSTLLSMFLPNAIVAATLCPIAVAMVNFSQAENSHASKKTLYLILLSIVWGAGLGGFGTPLGGAMNLVAIDRIEEFTGHEFMYITWTVKMLPYLVILATGTCAYLLFMKTDTRRLEGSRAYFKQEYLRLGKLKRSELISLILFLTAVLLAFTRPLYAKLLPDFKPFYGFLLMGVAAFFLPGDSGRLVGWDFAVKQINWGLIILFSGGLAVGNLLIGTGAAQTIADSVTAGGLTSLFALAVIFIALGMLLSNASSNTAATAITVPIVISIVAATSADPLPLVFITAAACNSAFILPTSIRAIPVGYGLDVGFMFKKGLAAVAICFALLVAAAIIVI